MSLLRQQLDQARKAHHDAVYPGDLALDVLGPPQGMRWRGILIGGSLVGAALAAGIALMILLRSHSLPLPTEQLENFTAIAPPTRPAMPVDIPLTAPYENLSSVPAMPEFPSIFGT